MNRGTVGEERGSKETDGCSLTMSPYRLAFIFFALAATSISSSVAWTLNWVGALQMCVDGSHVGRLAHLESFGGRDSGPKHPSALKSDWDMFDEGLVGVSGSDLGLH
jgi:hypothetical protein